MRVISMNQLNFFPKEETLNVEERINILQTRIHNIRSGLFKRYSECEKAIEFLEAEIEDLIKDVICYQKTS